MNDEHYIDGQHNGGVFNSFNGASYGYCYQNPVLYVDPNGKQVDFKIAIQESQKEQIKALDKGASHSESKKVYRKALNDRLAFKGLEKIDGHLFLDAAGLVPVFGEVFDGINAAWYAAEGDYINSALSASSMVPIAGYAAIGIKVGNKLVKTVIMKSVVKSDAKMLKIAEKVFKGNAALSKEANSLIKKASEGNFSGGKGAKDLGKGIFELRGDKGARVYYRENGGVMEILGYSNKDKQVQQEVINYLKNNYGK